MKFIAVNSKDDLLKALAQIGGFKHKTKEDAHAVLQCIRCGRDMADVMMLPDANADRREYMISGLCESCYLGDGCDL